MIVCCQVGDPIRFYHKEMEAYLVAEGLFDDELIEDGQFYFSSQSLTPFSIPLLLSLENKYRYAFYLSLRV